MIKKVKMLYENVSLTENNPKPIPVFHINIKFKK